MLRFTTKVYYTLKPLIPRGLRLWLRRFSARRRRRQSVEVWPISETAGARPRGWPGWPDGKQFAVVLTHDVEGATGIPNISSVLQVERTYGFCSSFNLVGAEAQVTEALRNLITSVGGEIGVHGWKHDGKLFFSRSSFVRQVPAIRRVLREWKAVGFRAPYMHVNLASLHELGLSYDCSTFDTDPFEPEPYGVHTVFPFWVSDGRSGGYVELPYTLVQDFTLFNVLGETTIDAWTKKVDWIAAKGGMVLVNTHPDYMNFQDESGPTVYPSSRYEDLLRYLQEEYAGKFWNALPREVASYYREATPPSSRNSRKRVCMVTYSNYETDNRVRRYAEALAGRGDSVEVVAIETRNVELGRRTMSKGVKLTTLQQREHDESTQWTYLYRLVRFLLKSAAFLYREHKRCRYDVVHVHNIPDFMVFAAWYPKVNGAGIILDIHDIVPELFSNKFPSRLSEVYFYLLKMVEKASTRFADHVIIANHLWFDKITSRSARRECCSVFINNVDRSVFYQRERSRTDGPLILLFHGTFQPHQGLDVAITALPFVLRHIAGVELHLYGGGAGGKQTRERLEELARTVGVGSSVRFFPGVPLQDIPQIVADADVGIVPKKADSFGNEAYSTKIMEFMSQGVPVVVSRTTVDSYYFDDELVEFFDSADSEDMARAIIKVLTDRQLRERRVRNGREYVMSHCWESVQSEYFNVVDRIQIDKIRSS